MFSKNFRFRKDKDKKNKLEDAYPTDQNQLLKKEVDQTIREPSISQATASSSIFSRRDSNNDQGAPGLNVVYTPENGHKADIVFIHGLGGNSRMTWSKDKNPELFWPLTFLPLEPDICLARILSFGYNADFVSTGNVCNAILDFAKNLLYDLKYSTDKETKSLNIGHVPLMFVVHSMGGLIVKEAYMQGQNDPEYADIIKVISSIIFLATPHRGTNLATVLNRILQSTPLMSSKQFISELTRNSSTLQKLNEQFRHIAPKLQIVSFYETQPTSIGLKNTRVMVLEKDSSLLGYPGETSKALDADHHGVCKYENPRDPNYITVRNILKSLMSKIISTSQSERPKISTRSRSQNLKEILAISEFPDIDFIFFRDQWTQGTNEWIFQEKDYIEWLDLANLSSSHHVLWLKGGAATGKSVLSSFVINTLVEQGICCQYFFIRFEDRKKRTISLLLRSIAYQIAQQIPSFLLKALELEIEAIDFEIANARTIWDRIYKSIIFKMDLEKELYWVIDGLDEANDARVLLKLLSELPKSSVRIRILLVSRDVPEIAAAVEKIPKAVWKGTIRKEGHREDLHCYISNELTLSGTIEFREKIVQRILSGANDNFLWVRLAVERVNSCHTHSAIEEALQECAPGMEPLYEKMALSIEQRYSPSDRVLASAVLQRVTCSFRVLSATELSEILEEESTGFLDIQRFVKNVCGGFVIVDNDGNVAMIHQTAREYLLGDPDRPLHVDPSLAHERLFLSCMKCLLSTKLRATPKQGDLGLLSYSATWWSHHLVSISPDSEEVANSVSKFLSGHWILTWIQFLATENRLRTLIQASKHLSEYATKRKKLTASSTEKQQVIEQASIENWAVDLVKLMGKFGHILRRNPSAIYKLIPPFCPHSSSIYQQFGKQETRSLKVTGTSTQIWDDSLARLSFGFGIYASSIAAAGVQIGVLASSGSIHLYDSSVFEEAKISPISHKERLYRMKFSHSGALLATYGFKTTKVWETATGKCKLTVENVKTRPRPLTMLIVDNKTLLVGTDDKYLRSLEINAASPTWQTVANFEEEELEGHFLNAASYMALNDDGSLMAVAYRGHPLSAWEIDGPTQISHCWRAREEVARGEVIEAVWHPYNPEIYGLYIEGVIFKWNPYCGNPEEISSGASRLAISTDGNLLATGDVHGTIKVFTTSGLQILYQLAFQDTVLGLAFSADSRRIYDVRGYYGNTWEPATLIRYVERSASRPESESESESESWSHYSVNTVIPSQRVDSITVLAASPIGQIYCGGTEYGRLKLFDNEQGKILELNVSKSYLSIEHLAWSDNGRFLCCSDSSKKVFILEITTCGAEVSAKTLCEISLKKDTEGPIHQLLFRPDSTHVLVATSSKLCSISLASASLHYSVTSTNHRCRWINHPLEPNHLLEFGPKSVRLLDWTLSSMSHYDIDMSLDQEFQSDSHGVASIISIERVLVTSDLKHIMVQLSLGHNSKEKKFLYFTTSFFLINKSASTEVERVISQKRVTPGTLPHHITSDVALALSFLKRDRLVFLSRNFSVCTRQISQHSISSQSMQNKDDNKKKKNATQSKEINIAFQTNRHSVDLPVDKFINEIFSLPADWISRDCLELCRVWPHQSSFLCPRGGDIAVVRCSKLV